MEEILIRYIGMILVIFLLTSLYGKASPFHTFAISLLLSVSVAYLTVYCVDEILAGARLIFQGQPINIVGLILGLMLFSRFSSKYAAISRIPVSITVGTMLGLSIRTTIFTQVIGFARSAILPFYVPGDAYQSFANTTTMIFTATILLFFIYTFPFATKGPVRSIGKAGEIFLYGALGGIAANSFLGNINSAAATLGFYLKPMSDAYIFLSLGLIILVIVIALDRRGLLEKYA